MTEKLSRTGRYRSAEPGVYGMFIWDGQPRRSPRKGEWYLSGSRIEAYRASHDLNEAYHIAVPAPAGVKKLPDVTSQHLLHVTITDGPINALHDTEVLAHNVAEMLNRGQKRASVSVCTPEAPGPVWHLFLVDDGEYSRLMTGLSESKLKADELVRAAAIDEYAFDAGKIGTEFIGVVDRDVDENLNL